MKKFLIGGVSLFAILSANNALAAGYTCEELIEYTSCNDGYYLNAGDCIEGATCGAGNYLMGTCPDGYVYSNAWCWENEEWIKDCDEGIYEVEFGRGCLKGDEDDPESWMWADASAFTASGVSATCTPCVAGSYQNQAGQYSCSLCDAGTYQPESGKTSCIDAPVGNYVAGVGATSYTACPATGLTDRSGATVVATTASTGSTALSACIVGENVEFQDTKGIYHFKSDCAYSVVSWNASLTEAGGCSVLAAAEENSDMNWQSDSDYGCMADVDGWDMSGEGDHVTSFAPKTEAACNALNEENAHEGSVEWRDGKCECSGNYWIFDENGLGCWAV